MLFFNQRKRKMAVLIFSKPNVRAASGENRIFCICVNKAADQLCSNCTSDQHLCFRYRDSTIPLLLIAKISSL